MNGRLECFLLLGHVFAVQASTCKEATLDFIVQDTDAALAVLEDDIRADLAKVGITVNTRKLEKDAFNTAMTSGDFHLCFSETWGFPYDPHSYAYSWSTPDEAHYAALKGMQAPNTQSVLTSNINNVLVEEDLQMRQQKWKSILTALHEQAIDLPFSGKRIPAVLNKRLTGYVPGEQQFDYPVHKIQVLSGSKTITVAPGSQTGGLFDSIGRLDAHTYRPNEFFANNWVYEGLVSYGANGVIEPSLATSWTVVDQNTGGQKYTFQLRQGVKFHDGADWKCAVAKLNFDHVLAPPLTTGDWHGWYQLPTQIASTECPSDYVFIINTKDKYYPLLQELTYIRPLRMMSPNVFANGLTTSATTQNSCHAGWGTITNTEGTITCAGVTGVQGTGPFKFVETKTNGDVQFDRNTAHWRSVPDVETVIVKKYASNADVMTALTSNSLDAVVGSGVLAPADLKTIQTQHTSTHQTIIGKTMQNRMVVVNANKAPTNDLKLRKVIMHAVNKAAIIDKELYGFAEPVDTLFSKDAPYCDIDLTPRWDYDFEKAQMLNCPAEPAQSSTSSTASEEEDGIDVTLVIVIIVVLVVVFVICAGALFMYGKSQGVLQQKLLQQSSQSSGYSGVNGQDKAAVVGQPGANADEAMVV